MSSKKKEKKPKLLKKAKPVGSSKALEAAKARIRESAKAAGAVSTRKAVKQTTARVVKVDVIAEIPLSDKEKVKRGEIACVKLNERDRLVLERKDVANKYAATIRALDSEAKKLLDEFETGFEKKAVSATEHKDFKRGVVEYRFNGKVVKSREMTFADRQEELPLGASVHPIRAQKGEAHTARVQKQLELGSPEAKACASGAAKMPRGERQALSLAERTNEEADARGLAESRKDIAESIREQTNGKTAHSSVDGPTT